MKVRGSRLELPARKNFGANCAVSTLTLPLSLAKGEATHMRAQDVPPVCTCYLTVANTASLLLLNFSLLDEFRAACER
jgi:hypothetical protein